MLKAKREEILTSLTSIDRGRWLYDSKIDDLMVTILAEIEIIL